MQLMYDIGCLLQAPAPQPAYKWADLGPDQAQPPTIAVTLPPGVSIPPGVSWALPPGVHGSLLWHVFHTLRLLLT